MSPVAIPSDAALAGASIFGQVWGWQHNGAQTYWGLSGGLHWRLGH